MSLAFQGILMYPTPPDADAGAGRRLWLAERIKPHETVLDAGGTGGMLKPWHQGHVTACDDLSGFGPGHTIAADTFVLGDVQTLPFGEGAFDVCVLAEVLEHVPDPVKALRAAARVAERVLITTPCESRWQNPIAFRVSGHIRFPIPLLFVGQLRDAGLSGTHALLEFGSWSFCVAEVSRG